MRILSLLTVLGAVLPLTFSQAASHSGSSIGGGVNYYVYLDDLDVDDINEDGFSYFASYKYHTGGLVGFEGVLEFIPDKAGEDTWAPQAYVILGQQIYVAAGIGIDRRGDDWANDPFYAFKFGLDLNLAGSLYLDIAANYRFEPDTDIDIDSDTVFLGAALRMGF